MVLDEATKIKNRKVRIRPKVGLKSEHGAHGKLPDFRQNQT